MYQITKLRQMFLWVTLLKAYTSLLHPSISQINNIRLGVIVEKIYKIFIILFINIIIYNNIYYYI